MMGMMMKLPVSGLFGGGGGGLVGSVRSVSGRSRMVLSASTRTRMRAKARTRMNREYSSCITSRRRKLSSLSINGNECEGAFSITSFFPLPSTLSYTSPTQTRTPTASPFTSSPSSSSVISPPPTSTSSQSGNRLLPLPTPPSNHDRTRPDSTLFHNKAGQRPSFDLGSSLGLVRGGRMGAEIRWMWSASGSGAGTGTGSWGLRRGLHVSSARYHGGIERPAPGTGIKVTFKDSKDTILKTVYANEGDDILSIAHEYDIDLEGACEGSIACSTCHVILDEEHYDMLEEPSDDENDMLDMAFGLTGTSRLGCQVKLTKELDGVVCTLPAATRNMYVDGAKAAHH